MSDASVNPNGRKEHKLEENPNNFGLRKFVEKQIVPNRKGLWTICFRVESDMTEKDVHEKFSQYGDIAELSFTTRYCFVHFTTKKSAVDAFVAQKQELNIELPKECYNVNNNYKASKENLYEYYEHPWFAGYNRSYQYNTNQRYGSYGCHQMAAQGRRNSPVPQQISKRSPSYIGGEIIDDMDDANHVDSGAGRKVMKPWHNSDKDISKRDFLQKKNMTVNPRTNPDNYGSYQGDPGNRHRSSLAEDAKVSHSSRRGSSDSQGNHQRAAPDTGHKGWKQKSVRSVRSKNDPLSNFFPCKFEFNKIVFRSVEHAYQWKKAMFSGEKKLADDIRLATTAKDCKLLAKHIRYVPEWDETKVEFMKELLLLKWEQVPAFREELEACRGRKIVHPVQSSYWGTQSTKSGKPGKNIFGQLLEDLLKMKDLPRQAYSEQKPKLSDGSADDKPVDAQAPSGDNKPDLAISRISCNKTHQSAAPYKAKEVDKPQLSCKHDSNNNGDVAGPWNNDAKEKNKPLDRGSDEQAQSGSICHDENGSRNQLNSVGIPQGRSADLDTPQMKGLFNGSNSYHVKSIGHGIIYHLSENDGNNLPASAAVVGGCEKLQESMGSISSCDSQQTAAPDRVKDPDRVGNKQDSSSRDEDNKNDTTKNDSTTYPDSSNVMTTGISYKVSSEKKEILNGSSGGPFKSIGRGYMQYQIPIGGMNPSNLLGHHARLTSGCIVNANEPQSTEQLACDNKVNHKKANTKWDNKDVTGENGDDIIKQTFRKDVHKNQLLSDTTDDKDDGTKVASSALHHKNESFSGRTNPDGIRHKVAHDEMDTPRRPQRKQLLVSSSSSSYKNSSSNENDDGNQYGDLQYLEDTDILKHKRSNTDFQEKRKLVHTTGDGYAKVVDTKPLSDGEFCKQESPSCRTSSSVSHQSAALDMTKTVETKHRTEQITVRSNYKKATAKQNRDIDWRLYNDGPAHGKDHPAQSRHREETHSRSCGYNTSHQRAGPSSQKVPNKCDDFGAMPALESYEDDTDSPEEMYRNDDSFNHPAKSQSFEKHQNHQDYGELNLFELCIRNFPYFTTEKELLKPFRLFGARGVKIINNQPGKRTLAFAQFKDYEAAVSAFTTLDMTDFNGSQLKVSFSRNTFCPEDIVYERSKHLQIRVNVEGLDD